MGWKLSSRHNARCVIVVYGRTKWLRVRIFARFARAMTFCFHHKFSIEYGKQETKNSKKIRYYFLNCFHNRLHIVTMELNYDLSL